MPSESRRKKKYAGAPVQQALIRRVLLYWFCYLCLSLVVGAALQIFRDPVNAFEQGYTGLLTSQTPSLIAAAVLLPIFVSDLVRFSLRFAGPVVRLHRTIQRLVEGHEFKPLRFRKKDYWHALADDFNRLLSGRHQNSPAEQ